MSYYNTTKIQGERLKEAKEKTETQEERIFKIFKDYKKPLSASEVWDIYGQILAPLTSIRRGLTVLMAQGKLIKTPYQKTGIYGMPEYYYDIRPVKK